MENQTLYQVSEITLNYKPKIRPQERPRVSSSNSEKELFKIGYIRILVH